MNPVVSETEETLELQMPSWTAFGPCLSFAALYVLFSHTPTSPILMPLSALIGFAFSWNWRLPGVFLATLLMFFVVVIGAYFPGSEHLTWDMGIAAAFALSFFINAMSLDVADEALQNVPKLRQDLIDANEEVLSLQKQGEKYPQIIKQLQAEKNQAQESLKETIERLQKESEGFAKLASEKEKAIEALKGESRSQETYLKRIESELFESHQKLREAEAHREQERKVQTKLNAEIERLQLSLTQSKDNCQNLTEQKEQEIKKRESLAIELKEWQVKWDKLLQESEARDKSYQILINEKQTLMSSNEALTQEKNHLKSKLDELVIWGDPTTRQGKALCRVEGMYQQLRMQYDEKAEQLDQNRRELFKAQEQLALLQKELEEAEIYSKPIVIEQTEKYILALIARISDLEKQNQDLEELVNSLLK